MAAVRQGLPGEFVTPCRTRRRAGHMPLANRRHRSIATRAVLHRGPIWRGRRSPDGRLRFSNPKASEVSFVGLESACHAPARRPKLNHQAAEICAEVAGIRISFVQLALRRQLGAQEPDRPWLRPLLGVPPSSHRDGFARWYSSAGRSSRTQSECRITGAGCLSLLSPPPDTRESRQSRRRPAVPSPRCRRRTSRCRRTRASSRCSSPRPGWSCTRGARCCR